MKAQPDSASPRLAASVTGRAAKFSPDGRWIAYVSSTLNENEVHVQGFPSGLSYQISTAGGTQPQWRRDGSELFYVAPDGKLMAVVTKLGPEFKYESPKPLFDTLLLGQNGPGGYAATADGQRFLMQLPDRTAGSVPFTVVTNWLDTVRQ